jgi:hypothetical protein
MREKRLSAITVIAAALAMVPAVIFAGGPSVELSPSQLILKSHGSQYEWVLTVGGPDGYYDKQVFAQGEIPIFNVSIEMPDGSYTYELTANWQPDAKIAAVLERARETGDYTQVEKLRLEGRIPEPIVISGSFMLASGSIIDSGLSEEIGKPRTQEVSTTKDQLILDDLIVDGSLCVGFDCVNGESFGFDTIRMKENNLRIRAYDTSNSASFPSNDWQLTFNSSENGGGSYFSVDDIDGGRTPFKIEAGARTNALVVEDSGDIGIGTGDPVADVHIKTGNTPTLRLEQDGSSGFTAQTWDLAGNEANFFLRDATNGSTLPIRVRPGASTSMIDIHGNDEIGIGTDSPSAMVHVRKGGTPASLNASTILAVQNNANVGDGAIISILAGTDGNSQIFFGDTASELAGRFTYAHGSDTMRFFTAEIERVRIDGDGDFAINCTDPGSDLVVGDGGTCLSGSYSTLNAGATQFTASSSRSIKENLEEVQVADILDRIAAIGVYNYDFIEGPKDNLGLMAEDFHQVFQRGSDKHISGQDVQMALWLAVRELAARNQELSERIADLESELNN